MRGLSAIFLCGLAALACGNASDGQAPKREPVAAAEPDPCRPRTLEELCGSRSCPASLQMVPMNCGSLTPTKRYATACGGTQLNESEGFTGVSWVFDERDELIGAVTWSDLPVKCADGSQSWEIVFGESCEPIGDGTDQCADSVP